MNKKMDQPADASVVRRLWEIAILAFVYFITARLGQMLSIPPGNITPVWIPSGVVLAVVLTRGYRVWPGIFLGAFVGNVWAYFSSESAGTILKSLFAGAANGIGDSLCAVVGAYLIQRTTGGCNPLIRASDVAKLIIYGGILGTGISALFGVTSLSLAGFLPWSQYSYALWTWWVGDGMGVLLGTPLLLAWFSGKRRCRFGCEELTSVVCLTAFGLLIPRSEWTLSFVALPLLMWAVFRFDPRASFLIIFTVAATTILAMACGYGPFLGGSPNVNLIHLQEFLAILIAPMIILHGALAERKLAEESLRNAHWRLENIIEGTHVGTWEWNVQTGEAVFSEVWAQIVGYTLAELTPISIKTWETLAHPDDMKRSAELLERHFAGELPYYNNDCRMKHKDGHWVWVHDCGRVTTRNGDGKPLMMFGSHTDITERKRIEEDLRESDEKHRVIFNNEIYAICIFDLETFKLLDVNEAFTGLYGYHREELISRMTIHDITVEREKSELATMQASREGTIFIPLRHHRKKDGTVIPVEIVGGPYVWKGKKVMFGLIHDISERKEAEAQREKLEAQNKQLQKSESLGRMAGAIAHHFNNQLQVVMMNLDFAMRGESTGDFPAEHLTGAMLSARKAAEVSRLMLIYLGQTNAKHEPLDLSNACLQSLPLIRAAMPKGVALETDLPAPGPSIQANASQIQQVLTNLVTNAWEASGSGQGSIRLSVKTVSAADIPTVNRFPVDYQIQARAYGCLEVADTGCGIDSKDIEKLFDPFFSSKFTGRGLGLAVVLGIVRAHQGVVTVESNLGRGSVFRVFVPVSADIVPRKPVALAQSPQRVGAGTVLVVDDEMNLLKVVATAIKSMGFTVLAAQDGVEAVEVFRQHQDEIRLVICDLSMPRMDGWQTLSTLRKLAPDITVILASGYSEAQVMDGNHPELPQAFLSKPYEFEQLSDVVFRVLDRKAERITSA